LDADTVADVRRAQAGDPDAFAGLIRQFERTALSVAHSVLGSASASGDVVQDAFLRAWTKLRDLDDPDRFAAWLCGIVRNAALDALRRLRRENARTEHAPALEPADPREDGIPGLSLDRAEDRCAVRRAIDELDDVSRSVVLLKYYEGLSSKEIGLRLGLAATAVDMRLSRARRRLAELLAGAFSADPVRSESVRGAS